jgi:hypothetical protein
MLYSPLFNYSYSTTKLPVKNQNSGISVISDLKLSKTNSHKTMEYNPKADLADSFKITHMPVSLMKTCNPVAMSATEDKNHNFSSIYCKQ